MEHHEMAEKLVEKCGISYEEAGDVLRKEEESLAENHRTADIQQE